MMARKSDSAPVDFSLDNEARIKDELTRRDEEAAAALEKRHRKPRRNKGKEIEAETGFEVPHGTFLDTQFKKDLKEGEITDLLEQAAALYKSLAYLLGHRKAKEAWLGLPPEKVDAGGRNPGLADKYDQENTRQLLMFFRHWQVQRPTSKPSDLRRWCASMLHEKRPGEFGKTEADIVTRIKRLVPSDKVLPKN